MRQKTKHTTELTPAECSGINGGIMCIPNGFLLMDEVMDGLSDLWTGIRKGFDAGVTAGSKAK